MKYFQLEGIIKEELLTRFLDFVNNNTDEEKTIYINSGGGKSNLAVIIRDIVNDKDITLVS